MQALELLGLTDGSIYGETYHKLFGWNPRGIVLHLSLIHIFCWA